MPERCGICGSHPKKAGTWQKGFINGFGLSSGAINAERDEKSLYAKTGLIKTNGIPIIIGNVDVHS